MVWPICMAQTADVFPGIIARNKAVLEYEKFVHHTFYPHIIHPYSRFRVYWEIFFLLFIPFRLITVTILWVFVLRESSHYAAILSFLRLFNMADIVLRFLTGYVESKTEIVVLQPKKIAANYLFKCFIFDFLPAIPINVLLLFFPERGAFLRGRETGLDAILFFFNVTTVLRTVTFFVYLYHTNSLFMWYPYLVGILGSIALIFLIFLFLINSVYIWFFASVEVSLLDFLEAQLTLLGRLKIFFDTINLLIENYSDSAVAMCMDFVLLFLFLLVAVFSTIFFMVHAIKFALLKMKKQEKLKEFESRIFSFAEKRNLTESLKQKMLLYFRILLDNKYCREDEIFHYIPETFRAEITFHLCLPLLKTFFAFEGLPTYILRRLAEGMTYQLHLPNELVMRASVPTLSMYFIQRGTLALYSVNHVELYHFEAGSSINGRNMVLGDQNVLHYAISIEVTEVYRLDHENFMEIMRAYPKLLKNIVKKVQQDKSEITPFGEYTSEWKA